MMALCFILLFVAIILAWIGYRRLTLSFFAVSLIIAIITFYDDISSKLNINL